MRKVWHSCLFIYPRLFYSRLFVTWIATEIIQQLVSNICRDKNKNNNNQLSKTVLGTDNMMDIDEKGNYKVLY